MQMSGNTANLGALTQQMQQIQTMQMNLQSQMGQAQQPTPAISTPQMYDNNFTNNDDNSFLNEDLPNLADKIQQVVEGS